METIKFEIRSKLTVKHYNNVTEIVLLSLLLIVYKLLLWFNLYSTEFIFENCNLTLYPATCPKTTIETLKKGVKYV